MHCPLNISHLLLAPQWRSYTYRFMKKPVSLFQNTMSLKSAFPTQWQQHSPTYKDLAGLTEFWSFLHHKYIQIAASSKDLKERNRFENAHPPIGLNHSKSCTHETSIIKKKEWSCTVTWKQMDDARLWSLTGQYLLYLKSGSQTLPPDCHFQSLLHLPELWFAKTKHAHKRLLWKGTSYEGFR